MIKKNISTLGWDHAIARQREEIAKVLGSLIPKNRRVWLLDFPNHSNVGDSAIWLGELYYLRAYRPDLLLCGVQGAVGQAFSSNDVLLIHGGGNLGDLWPSHQIFREQLLDRFPSNLIVQLPQSSCFTSVARAQRAAHVFQRHKNFWICARDSESASQLATLNSGRVKLCPDLAMLLELKEWKKLSINPPYDLLFLKRNDKETYLPTQFETDGLGGGIRTLTKDWVIDGEPDISMLASRVSRRLDQVPGRLAMATKKRLFHSFAEQRVARGVALLTQTRFLITDRLHAHIFCVLLGIPHYVVDNNYGKLSSYAATWYPEIIPEIFMAGFEQAILQYSIRYD